jgi:putative endonuclease
MTAWVYIVASRRNGTLYVGVTSDLPQRGYEHREGLVDGFSRQHGCKRLVWYDEYADVVSAILHEKRLKRWQRAWKIALIETMNPDWDDLYERLNA